MKHIILLGTCLHIGFAMEYTSGWNYINLHCRDNDNRPVDWWYIYKPPASGGSPLNSGRNFSYITSETAGRWQPSIRSITAESMLQFTLSPIYRRTYQDYLALMIYGERGPELSRQGSTTIARGVQLADQMGGVWIGHTVPGLIDLNADRPSFPINERAHGHLLICLSLDLVSLNKIGKAVVGTGTKIGYMKIPDNIKKLLPMWNAPVKDVFSLNSVNEEIMSRGGTLRAEISYRSPGSRRSLYKAFARTKNLVLDVYGNTPGNFYTNICGQRYSLRTIPQIALKVEGEVCYVEQVRDRTRFAVSTAASWQTVVNKTGPQYWACISNLDKDEDTGLGGLLMCVENYSVWRSFDLLKIKEPIC